MSPIILNLAFLGYVESPVIIDTFLKVAIIIKWQFYRDLEVSVKLPLSGLLSSLLKVKK